MPKVEDILAQPKGAKYFSTLDLQAGYPHIQLDESSIPKTAFTSPFGKYEYFKVPFGHAQAQANFQELMTGVLKDFPFAIAYLEDIIIFSRTAEEHQDHIKQVFKKIKESSLINETQEMPLLCQRDPVPWTHPKHHRHQTTTIEDSSHQKHAPT